MTIEQLVTEIEESAEISLELCKNKEIKDIKKFNGIVYNLKKTNNGYIFEFMFIIEEDRLKYDKYKNERNI